MYFDGSCSGTGQLYADLVLSFNRHLIALGVESNGNADARDHVIAEMLGEKNEEAVFHNRVHVGERAVAFFIMEDMRCAVQPCGNWNSHGNLAAETGDGIPALVKQFNIVMERCPNDIQAWS